MGGLYKSAGKLLAAALLVGGFIAHPVIALADSANANTNFVTDSSQLKQEMLDQIDMTKEFFSGDYAPAYWKIQHEHWNLPAQVAKIRSWVENNPNPDLKAFQRRLLYLMESAKDFHTSIEFDWTEKSTLPFTVQSANGHYYIVYIDRTKLTEDQFPFAVGDEILDFGGQPVAQAVADIRHKLGGNTPQTDEMLADLMLTNRAAIRGDVVPKGIVEVTGLSKGKKVTVALEWDHTPEVVTPGFNQRQQNLFASSAGELGQQNFVSDLRKEMVNPTAMSMTNIESKNNFGIGTKNSFLPKLGSVTEEFTDGAPYVHGYIYQLPNGKSVGYIRLPSYDSKNNDQLAGIFTNMINEMEAKTDALVIDELNNPGGSVLYVYGLVSHLATEPIMLPNHAIKLNQATVVDAYNQLQTMAPIQNAADVADAIGQTIDGCPISYSSFLGIKDYYQSILDQWHEGKSLSDPIPLYLGVVNPAPTGTYTKPILILTDSLDFSGADFFPAIMQDAHRAVIMGARTAGAGGFINEVKFPNDLGIKLMSFTGSIAFRQRPDHRPIENLGVTPDVPYQITADDYRHNFRDYVAAINKQVSSMIGTQAPATGNQSTVPAPKKP